METIKEYETNKADGSITFAIRTQNNDSSLEFFINLYKSAKEDFPELTEEEVKIVQYGGRRIRHMFGIEFRLPENTKIPESYTMTTLENTL